jgi:hypothetical protein
MSHCPFRGLIRYQAAKPVGRPIFVEAPEIALDDSAMFAKRIGRGRLSRVVLNTKEPTSPTPWVSCWVEPEASNEMHWKLTDAYIGRHVHREPWVFGPLAPSLTKDEVAYSDSLSFWRTHAFVYDAKTMGPLVPTTWREVLEHRERFQHLKDVAA